MEILVRPFHPHDYPRLAKIRCEAEGEDATVEDIRRYDERWDYARYEKVRVVAQDEEGVAIGYGELHHEPDRFDPRAYFLRLAVDPAYHRRGVATAIWEQIQGELEERSATVVRVRTEEGSPGAAWARRQRFVRSGGLTTGQASFELRLGRSAPPSR